MEKTFRKSKVVPLRIPEGLDELAALSAREHHTDKATALRQWIHHGAEVYVVKMVSEGRITIGRAAEMLGITIYDIHRIAETNKIELGATEAQRGKSRELVRRLIRTGEIDKLRRDKPAEV